MTIQVVDIPIGTSKGDIGKHQRIWKKLLSLGAGKALKLPAIENRYDRAFRSLLASLRQRTIYRWKDRSVTLHSSARPDGVYVWLTPAQGDNRSA